MVLAIAFLVGGLFAEEHTPIQTDPNKWVDQSSQVIHDIDAMQAATGASSELGVFVQDRRGVFTDQMSGFVTTSPCSELQRYPVKLSTVSSLPTTIYYLMAVPGETAALPVTGADLPTGADLRAAYDVAPVDLQRSMVSAHDTAVNVVFQTGPSTLAVRKEVTLDIRANVHPPGRHLGDTLGSGRDRRRAARQPDLEPAAADLPGARRGVRCGCSSASATG